MHDCSNFNQNVAMVFSSKRLVEFDLIGEDEYEMELFDPYVVSSPLFTMRASYQTLIAHRPNPSERV